ncbi:hypothetical protein V1477_016781 [Vespula maculifrons]|uniref:Uncharacterized protein n=1 Tax=Vespula maculifrons TaxID=7453 RepID=A0ABD2B453_VESMC
MIEKRKRRFQFQVEGSSRVGGTERKPCSLEEKLWIFEKERSFVCSIRKQMRRKEDEEEEEEEEEEEDILTTFLYKWRDIII